MTSRVSITPPSNGELLNFPEHEISKQVQNYSLNYTKSDDSIGLYANILEENPHLHSSTENMIYNLSDLVTFKDSSHVIGIKCYAVLSNLRILTFKLKTL